jgi:type II secretory pathway component PulF
MYGFGKTLMGCVEHLSAPVVSMMKACSGLYESILGPALRSPSWEAGLVAAFIVVGLGLVAVAVLVSRLLRRFAGFVFERLPIMRSAVLQARWSHALKIISLLLERGIPLDRALESAAGSDLDRPTRRVLRRMSEGTLAGLSFSEVLDRERRRVPRSLKSAVVFGEHTGRLPELLSRLSHMYRLRAERTVRVTLDIAFPLAIIGCGLLVSAINTRFFVLMANLVDEIMNGMR